MKIEDLKVGQVIFNERGNPFDIEEITPKNYVILSYHYYYGEPNKTLVLASDLEKFTDHNPSQEELLLTELKKEPGLISVKLSKNDNRFLGIMNRDILIEFLESYIALGNKNEK